MKTSLFEKTTLGKLKLKNRAVMAPMTRSRAIGNVANELMAEYYAQRAGAGLIVTEGTSPSPDGLGYARIPALFLRAHVRAWRKVTRRVHEKNGRIFVQLMHTGRISHAHNLPPLARTLAPSAIRAPGMMWTDREGPKEHPVPEAMNEAEILEAIQEHVTAAKLAIEAGFDGVELHGANGYLINQFLNQSSNQRGDAWGGSPSRRIRFAVEVAREVAKAIGPERVGFRISPYGDFNAMEPTGHDAEYALLALALSDLGLAYLHVVNPAAKHAEAFRELQARLRAGFKGAMILAGGYDRERAEADLAAGRADLIAFGTPFISNPDLVLRLEHGLPLAQADKSSFYTADEKGYTDYPFGTSLTRRLLKRVLEGVA